ncbi:hypothetical protein N7455_007688 [Penicillium solitum]|uniref:uncharacterized protein n=1 Tax=Penicillium solitum TaxID=60172 RepID=UPI0032C4923D|nr:hypothetical protein N7455_007688 [Penicillium solitum]
MVEAVELCYILLLSGSAVLVRSILRMNDAPGRAAYPAGTMVNELQQNGDSVMIFLSRVDPFSGSLPEFYAFDDDGKGVMCEPMCTL